MGLKFDLIKYLNLIFSIFISSIFPKISGNVEGTIVYRCTNFRKNLSRKKISGSNFM